MPPLQRRRPQPANVFRAVQQLRIRLLGQRLQRGVHRLRRDIQRPLLRLHLENQRARQRQAHADA
ncbi:hypothetical protein D3C79_1008230 [compost metagenome]